MEFHVIDTIEYRAEWTYRYPDIAAKGEGLLVILAPSEPLPDASLMGQSVLIHRPDGSYSEHVVSSVEKGANGMPGLFFSGLRAADVPRGRHCQQVIGTLGVSVWHHKGEFIRGDGDALEYRYFPDHVTAPAVSGIFRVRPADWSWTNVVPADAEAKGLVSIDVRCIEALIYKLQKEFKDNGPPPATIFFIA